MMSDSNFNRMRNRYFGNLSSRLKHQIEILELKKDEETGNYAWVQRKERWADVELDTRKNIFSEIGIGARGATILIRPDHELTLHQAMRWQGQFLFLTSIILGERRDRQEIKAAICYPATLTAKHQARTGRDAMNRPMVEQQSTLDFPGILTEMYYRNESDEIIRKATQRRVLVTPKAIVLRAGDLVQQGSEAPYTVRQVLDLDPYKNEYVIERQEDV